MSPRIVSARVSALLLLYSFLMSLSLVLAAPWWLWKMLSTGKYREGLLERLGRVPARLRYSGAPRPAAIWVHAVSVGEVLAAGRLIEELERAFPERTVYVSTTTRAGQTLARSRLGAERVFYLPLDFAFAMRAWLRFLRPALVVLVESEFWPRMLVECRRAHIPIAVVNARVSDRSWPRYQRLRLLWRPLLRSLALVLAQSQRDAERLRSLGAQGALSVGNLKYDVRASAEEQVTAELQLRLPSDAAVIVCGSTLAGEEDLLLHALPLSRVITILAPRHPERFDEVAGLLAARHIPYVRRSSWLPSAVRRGNVDVLTAGSVILLDSVGELASVYALATLAVVGGGFLWPGGHNPLEPAQFGVPVVVGSHYANFREVVEGLLKANAVVLADASGLPATLARLLSDPEERRLLGERGRRVFEQEAGATRRTLSALLPLVQGCNASAFNLSESGIADERIVP